MPQNKKTGRIEGKAKANKAAFAGLTGMTKRKPYVPKGKDVQVGPTESELVDQMIAGAEGDPGLGGDETYDQRLERETRPDPIVPEALEAVTDLVTLPAETLEAKPPSRRAGRIGHQKANTMQRKADGVPDSPTDLCTFAIRIPRAESASIHRAAGSGKASKWARAILAAAAAGKLSEIEIILSEGV